MKGALIGRGGSAEVYEWGRDRVLKLFNPQYAYSADMEFETTRAVHAAGVRAPETFERVQVEGREGIVFERIDGPTLLETPRAEQAELPVRLAQIHAEIHAHESAELPARSARKQSLVLLSAEDRAGLDARNALVPDGRAVCHALFHPGHVILSSRGPVVIDWPDAFSGPAALDVARSAVFLRYLGVTSAAEAPLRKALADGYLQVYLALTGMDEQEVARCKPLVAFTLLRYVPAHPDRAELERLASI